MLTFFREGFSDGSRYTPKYPSFIDLVMKISTTELAKSIRIQSLMMVHRARASHIGSALSIADIVAVLYGRVMSYESNDPRFESRDRVILSKGHACVAIYSALSLVGFFPLERLREYGVDNSDFMNHISSRVPGVEFSTGSLGHGLPFAVGKALYCKVKDLGWRSFVIVGDGEMDEGSNWEAMMFAAHHGLNRLNLIIDCNNLQSLTTTSKTLDLEPLHTKIESFGWEVVVVDGHDHDALIAAMSGEGAGRPRCVLAKTVKGKGVSFMENSVDWHYKNPSDEELDQALKELHGEFP